MAYKAALEKWRRDPLQHSCELKRENILISKEKYYNYYIPRQSVFYCTPRVNCNVEPKTHKHHVIDWCVYATACNYFGLCTIWSVRHDHTETQEMWLSHWTLLLSIDRTSNISSY